MRSAPRRLGPSFRVLCTTSSSICQPNDVTPQTGSGVDKRQFEADSRQRQFEAAVRGYAAHQAGAASDGSQPAANPDITYLPSAKRRQRSLSGLLWGPKVKPGHCGDNATDSFAVPLYAKTKYSRNIVRPVRVQLTYGRYMYDDTREPSGTCSYKRTWLPSIRYGGYHPHGTTSGQ